MSKISRSNQFAPAQMLVDGVELGTVAVFVAHAGLQADAVPFADRVEVEDHLEARGSRSG